MRRAVFVVVLLLGVAHSDGAAREFRLPLRDGQLSSADLSAVLCQRLGLPRAGAWLTPEARIDLSGLRGCLWLAAMNQALGEGCRLSIADDVLLLSVDAEKLPRDLDQTRQAVRVFTAVAAPQATADQARLYGLHLPAVVEDRQPLVILVHGLDCNPDQWTGMATLLQREGFQIARFCYPSDQPLADSADLLAQHMIALRETFPATPQHLIAHSMGALVARAYVEGDRYAGGVDRLILLAPPNQGARWIKWRWALELQEHYRLWKTEPTWQPSWMITDGLGEAGRDLYPDSEFLGQLNALPRRQDVRYTIVAGSRHLGWRMAGDCVGSAARFVPRRASGWWGVRQARSGVRNLAESLRRWRDDSDGPVAVDSARLAGVDDFVMLEADHTALYCPPPGGEPAAWTVIRQRLATP